MAKTGFWLRGAKGKLAGTTIYKGKTGTIQREIVSPSNPRTEGQMRQRSKFLSAVRFYSRANQRYFKFAFEGKRQGESDFNAFMRANANMAPYITKAQGNNIGFPMIAPWVLTQGSLSGLRVENTGKAVYVVLADDETGYENTVAYASKCLLAKYPELREGDIITSVLIQTQSLGGTDFVEDLDATNIPMESPLWDIYQFKIDTADDRLAPEAGIFLVTNEDGEVCMEFNMDADAVVAAAITVSRNTSSGLKVSNTILQLNDAAYEAYNAMRSEAHIERVVAWWGAQQEAILQGSIADNSQQKVSAKVTLIGGQRPVAELSYSAGQAKSVGITFDSDPVGVTADNFIVEGEGVTKTYNNSILTLTFANPGEYSIKFGSQKIAIAAVEGAAEPEFTGFKGSSSSIADARTDEPTEVGERLDHEATESVKQYVLVSGSNLASINVAKITFSFPVEVVTDSGDTFLSFTPNASGSYECKYNGTTIFSVYVDSAG